MWVGLDPDEIAIRRVFEGLIVVFGSNHARVFKCLLSTEAKTAKQIIDETMVYRAVVYRTLKDLLRHGLIKTTPSSPALFFVEKPVQKTRVLINKKKRELDKKVKELKKIINNATSLSGEEYLIMINGGQKKLINKKTKQTFLDEYELKELRKVIDEKIKQVQLSKLKPWQLKGRVF